MTRVGLMLCLWAASLVPPSAAGAEGAEARFAAAQERFDAARRLAEDPVVDRLEVRQAFHEAARAFASIADDGTASVNLFVNTGNAYGFAGDPARGLLWYLRAHECANTPETRAGLATLRRVCGADPWPHEKTSISRVLMSWHHDLRPFTKQMILLAFYPLGGALLWVGIRSRRVGLRRVAVSLMIVGAVFGVSDLVTTTMPDPPWAVVVESTPGYAGDGRTYSTVVERIAPGQEVRVIETRESWVRIELPSRQRCWVPADAADQV